MAGRGTVTRALLIGGATLALAACEPGKLDFDLRNDLSRAPLDTTDAAMASFADRPEPDGRGIISYEGYQVAVAQRGDTVGDVAARVGVPASELATYNGLPGNVPLRNGEVLALPRRVTATASQTAAAPPRTASTGAPGAVDVTTLAGNAIDRSDAAARPAAATPPAGDEPVRHKVVRGETAYSIARLYGVPVKALAEWNGLGTDLSVREGQYLLIPVADGEKPAPQRVAAVTPPGAGTPTPTPPSAAEPLPAEDAKPLPPKETPPSPDLSKQATQASASDARMIYPVQGKVIRAYVKKKNDGIDIGAPAGTPVRAADGGLVAAITRDTEGVPILVLRHDGNVLTVYAGVDNVAVNKGDRVKRGQEIARVRAGDPSFLHFEVREGFESVDPNPYLE
ncbi:MAG: peptidoglycan DD-metalloendopeptidase family protein [Tranquillimonas sp.]